MKEITSNKKSKEKDYHQDYMNLLIHSADVSNPTKPFSIYLRWAKLVFEEFCQQGDKEKALGLVCTCDRNTVKLNKNQIGFIDYVVEGYVSLETHSLRDYDATIVFSPSNYLFVNLFIVLFTSRPHGIFYHFRSKLNSTV